MDQYSDLYSALNGAENPQTPVDESMYLGDMAYHAQAYAVEEALRQEGVLPEPDGVRTPKPYDEDLRKLIENVPVE